MTLREKHPTSYLVLAGPVEERDGLSPDVAARLDADGRVRMTRAWTDTPPLYAAADLVVLPSYREGFPNTPLEAAAMSLPSIVTDATGCVDAVEDGLTGTIVPVRSISALITAIDRYLLSPALRRSHGQAGRRRVIQQFEQAVIWKELLALYASLLRWRPNRRISFAAGAESQMPEPSTLSSRSSANVPRQTSGLSSQVPI